MTPAEYRALAARVETEAPNDPLNEAAARALGFWWPTWPAKPLLPDFLTDPVNLAAALRAMAVGLEASNG